MAPREAFYPPDTRNLKERSAVTNSLHLVKISPNLELFEKVSKKELVSFHYFMNTVARIKRVDTLIMCLERWIPDCGPQLIKNGLRVFCHPRELTSEQLLLAYRIFTSLPLYEGSVFHYHCKQFAAKLGEKDEEISNLKIAKEVIDMEEDELLES
ncbi:dimethyladenosine transferase 2, mitochondrial-like [Homarus americanus]|nr:dimethyladenosine transferase 2, mitochondrial-like [Homarus americanus]